MNNDKKKLWIERVNDFRSSGLTCKAWCDEHQVSSSTMGYWVRKLDRNEKESYDHEPVFAKLKIIIRTVIVKDLLISRMDKVRIFIKLTLNKIRFFRDYG